jgi:hypothetical protein
METLLRNTSTLEESKNLDLLPVQSPRDFTINARIFPSDQSLFMETGDQMFGGSLK